jgi:hypothetical protein
VKRYLAAIFALGSAAVCAAEQLAPADDTAIRDLELKSWVAWKAQDATFFEQFLSDDHVEVHGYGVTTKANVVGAVRKAGCVVQMYALGPMTLTPVTPESVLVSYRAEQDTRCGGAKVPSPVWATSLYVKRSGKWVNVLYQQTPAL